MRSKHNYLWLLLLFVLACSENPLTSQAEVGPIIFTSDSGKYTQIYSINKDGSGLIQLTTSPFNNFRARWSRDGEWTVFNSRDRTPDHHLHSVVMADKHGHNERAVVEHGYGPVFSPDSDRIAFAFDTQFPGWGGKRDVVVYDLETQTATLVLPDSNDYFLADWSPDGRYLLVTATAIEDLYSPPRRSKICLIDCKIARESKPTNNHFIGGDDLSDDSINSPPRDLSFRIGWPARAL